jgi:hypothetical protein
MARDDSSPGGIPARLAPTKEDME